MQSKSQKKQTVSKVQIPKGKGSFISKLIEILKLYPQVIHWTEDGTKIKVSNVKKMEKEIIPSYYRHSNINSFVRQLNMYYFSKLETQDKNQMQFENKNFTKANSDNFHLLQRRNKGRDELLDKIHDKFQPTLDRIKKNLAISEDSKEMLTVAIQYQQIVVENLEKIKHNIKNLSLQMKNSRGKEVKQILAKLKNYYLEKVTENIESGKNIDEFIREKLCNDETEKMVKGIQQSYPENSFMNPSQNYERKSLNHIIPVGSMPFPLKSQNEIVGNHHQSEDESDDDQVSFGEKFKGQRLSSEQLQNIGNPDSQ